MRAAVACLLVGLLACSTIQKVQRGEALDTSDVQNVAKAVKTVQSLTEEVRPEQEYYVGRSVATNILARHDYKYRDAEALQKSQLVGLTAYVNKVGALVGNAAIATRRDGDRPAPVAGWHFVVVDSDAVNAFAAPGGFIFVTTAAVRAARSEDELACVLAHEVAHVVRGHALGNIKKSRYANVGSDVLQAAGREALTAEQRAQLTELMDGMINDMMDAFFVKGYSRDTEFEADRLGVQIAAAAGYDPSAMRRFLETLAGMQDTGSGGMFATHPKAADRIEKVAEAITRAGGGAKPAKVRDQRFAKAVASLK